MDMLRCVRCGFVGGATLFETGKSVCRPCERARRARWRRANAARLATCTESPADRPCARCGEVKPASAFSPSTARRDGLHSYCRACLNAASRTPEARRIFNDARNERRAEMTPAERLKDRGGYRPTRRDIPHDAHVAAYQRVARDLAEFVERAARTAARVAERRARLLAAGVPEHVGSNRAKKLRRKFAIERATPVWADRDAIAAVYAEADRISKERGEVWRPDHLVPLRNPLVCGLHVPANLFPMRQDINERKGNLVWPDMP